jgi:hypothetical protein
MAKTTYDQWAREVDIHVNGLCSLSKDDLPDCPYHDWYTNGKSPKQAARSAVSRAKKEYGL